MRIHYIQHVAFESTGYLETVLKQENHSVTATKIWEAPIYPAVEDFDGLIIMGGPMSVQDEKQYPWLATEKKFISAAIQAHKKVMGICLGAQLIAQVLGAAVYPNTYKEIGWFPVQFEPSFSEWTGSHMNSSLTVFHWHGDTFDLPAGAINQASSAACKHQFFTYSNHVAAIQFHLEVTPASLHDMVLQDDDELQEDRFVQTPATILNPDIYYAEAHDLLSLVVKKIFNG